MVHFVLANQVVLLCYHRCISLRNRPNRCYCYYARAGIYRGALQDPTQSTEYDPYKLDIAKYTSNWSKSGQFWCILVKVGQKWSTSRSSDPLFEWSELTSYQVPHELYEMVIYE